VIPRKFAAVVGVLVVALAVSPVSEVRAQGSTGTITGVVRQATTNQPLSGATVTLQGTQRSAVTDQTGRYTLRNVPAGARTVRATLIGYESRTQQVTVAAGAEARADFGLPESAVALEGLVVTGQGTSVERRKLATAPDVISTEAIERAPVTDVGQLLQGRVTGATVQTTSAQPGQAPLVRFRGVTSIFGSQTPVIYVDGVRVDNSRGKGFGTGGEETSALSDLLASDIERIEITKGGAASTLYGSDAAAGVIQIFTKRGSSGKPTITTRIEQGYDTPETKFIKDVTFSFPEEQYPEFYANPGFNPDFVKDEYLKDGYFQNYYVGVSGGNEGATYNVSGRVQNSTGVQPKNEEAIYALRGGMQAFVGDNLRLDFTGNYTRNTFGRLFNGTAISDPLTALEVGDALFFSGAETLDEALRIFLLPDINEEVNRFTFGTTASYNPSPLFNSRFTVGVDYRSSEQRILEPTDFVVSSEQGEINRYNRNFTAVTLDYAGTLSYPREGRFTSDFTFGVQGFREDESQIFATGRNFLPGSKEFDAAANITASEVNTELFNGGIFLQERVGLADRVFLEGGVRFDGNSTFGDDVKFKAYPKLGATYTVSDEPFFQDRFGGVVNALKLRAAYGEAGKPARPFDRDRTLSAVPFRGTSAFRFANPGNQELRPEVTATFETGVDAGFLDNRVGVNFTYYNAKTRDALIPVAEQLTTGFRQTQLRNIGEIANEGIELGVNLGLIRRENVDWDLGVSYSTFRNEVTDLGDVSPFSLDIGRRVEEGRPVGAYFVNTPIDTNNDGLNDSFERQFKGTQPFPTQTGSFTSNLTLFRALSFNALADWARGATVVDYGSAWASFNGLERVTFPTRFSRSGEAVRKYSYTQAFSSLLLDGDYFKLRELGARYALPRRLAGRMGVDRATLYGTVRNVYTWVPEKQCLFADDCLSNLVDPELNGVASSDVGNLQLGGATSITLPAPRQFRLGVEVSF
jgi:TonB-linked SusC/RagA family outer membrane protein